MKWLKAEGLGLPQPIAGVKKIKSPIFGTLTSLSSSTEEFSPKNGWVSTAKPGLS